MRLLLFCLVLILVPVISLAQLPLSATPTVGELKQQLRQAQQDSTRLRLCVLIGQYYLTRSQFDSVYRYTRQGLDLAKTAPSAYYAGDLYHFLARYYRNEGEYSRGILLMQTAIQLARKARSISKTTQFHYTLAMLYADAGDLSKSVDQIGANLNYLQTCRNDDMLAANYLLMVELFGSLNNPAMQEQYRNRYLALVTPSWPADHRMLALELKAEVLEKKGRIREAGRLYRQALLLARETDNSTYIIGMLSKQGINQRSQEHNKEALSLFKQAFDLSRATNAVGDMAGALRETATTYLAMQRPQEALVQARYAVTLSRQNKQVDGLLASLKCLVLSLKANDRFEEALTVFEEEVARKERHFSESNMKKIAQMQAVFEAETKENTIKTLQKNAQISQLKTLRQQEQLTLVQRTQYATFTIVALLILLVGVVYYFLRKTQRDYALLSHQQQLLQQTAQELAEVNGTKDRLFSLISHDLRSPVASMKMNIRQIQEVDTQPQSLLPLMGFFEKQVDTVLSLLTNLLDWSMIQLNGFQVLLQPISLYTIAEEAGSQASDSLRQKKITLINQVQSGLSVMADKHQLHAVVRNVLGNAIKFTPPNGYIRLLTVQDGQHIELQIRDSGVGMSAEQLETLFSEPAVRTGTAGERGVGLGLRICREMMDRQGGQLAVERMPKGGTLVRIRLAACSEQANVGGILPASSTFQAN